jgi:anti-sigma factor RsiW
MSSEPTLPEVDGVDEELVAYLDGELDADNRVRVEKRLAADAVFRKRLRMMQRTWDALDVLGRADASEAFTRTTVEFVAVHAAKDVQHEKGRQTRRQIWSWVGWTACGLAAAAAGFFALTQVLARPDRQLVRDLPVLERVDEYRNADSPEFLKALDESGLFAAELESDELAAVFVARADAAPPEQKQETYAQAAARIEAMTAEEKAKLLQKKERFDALSPAERDRLRMLGSELTSRPDGERLFGVLKRYNNWLKTLTSAQQAELMELPIDKRLAKIKDLQRSQIESHFLDISYQLEKEDIHTIYAWMEDFVSGHQDQILTKTDPRFAGMIVATPNPSYRRYLLVRTLFGRPLPPDSPLPLPTEQDFAALAVRVSPTLQYELIMQKTDENRRSLVMTCARYAVYARFAPPPPTDEELSKFYATLKAEDRERVEKLEPRQMRRELIQLYNRNRLRAGPGGRRPSGPPGEPGSGISSPPEGPPPFVSPGRPEGKQRPAIKKQSGDKDEAASQPPDKS